MLTAAVIATSLVDDPEASPATDPTTGQAPTAAPASVTITNATTTTTAEALLAVDTPTAEVTVQITAGPTTTASRTRLASIPPEVNPTTAGPTPTATSREDIRIKRIKDISRIVCLHLGTILGVAKAEAATDPRFLFLDNFTTAAATETVNQGLLHQDTKEITRVTGRIHNLQVVPAHGIANKLRPDALVVSHPALLLQL